MDQYSLLRFLSNDTGDDCATDSSTDSLVDPGSETCSNAHSLDRAQDGFIDRPHAGASASSSSTLPAIAPRIRAIELPPSLEDQPAHQPSYTMQHTHTHTQAHTQTTTDADRHVVLSEQHSAPPPQRDLEQEMTAAAIVALSNAIELCFEHGLSCAAPSLRASMTLVTSADGSAFDANDALLSTGCACKMCPRRLLILHSAITDAENKLRDLACWRVHRLAPDVGRSSFILTLTRVAGRNCRLDPEIKARFLQTYSKVMAELPCTFQSNHAKKKVKRGKGRPKRRGGGDQWHVEL
jgi:hypothetical protein